MGVSEGFITDMSDDGQLNKIETDFSVLYDTNSNLIMRSRSFHSP